MSLSTVKILVASDIHAGYGELKQPNIRNDSFEAFREVLKYGIEHEVDFVLLGGDLFHENNPSRETQLEVVRSIRKYCFNNKDVPIEFVSDPSVNFQHSSFSTVNYEDPNINVGMPIFTIHGNHDDLSGKGLTSLDLLHEAGLVNLFGKFNDVDKIEVSPILLRKRETKIALYGISSQRDDRLCRAFMQENVKFLRPTDDPDSWFNILVLHQNRPRRSTSRTTGSYLPVKYIPAFMDLVIWGHEHESIIEPQYFAPNDSGDGFYIIQPGSTVATSLSKEETVPKHCAIISVREDRKFQSKPIRLATPRQIFVEELILDNPPRKLPKTTVRQPNMLDEEIISKKIEEILTEAKNSRGPRQPPLPLVRLKVVYSGAWLNIPPINGRKFGMRYSDRVANPLDMISVRTIRPEKPRDDLDGPISDRAKEECANIDDMINKYFSTCDIKHKMDVLTDALMTRSLKEYANVDTTYVAADKMFLQSVKNQINVMTDKLKSLDDFAAENVDEEKLEKDILKAIHVMKKARAIPAVNGAQNGAGDAQVNLNLVKNENDDEMID
uniref:Mre11 DNA-binding domain-containing protein n=1 Tax=Acrobeloides nanus TaxID=290746 RepID=A0A914CAC5_9BILA